MKNPCLACPDGNKDKNNEKCTNCAARVEYVEKLQLENSPREASPIQPSTSHINVHKLRELLVKEIYNLREGKTTASKVNAIVSAVDKIFQSVKLEMEYYKMIKKVPKLEFIEGPGSRSVNNPSTSGENVE